ncbi:GGDEF domain-containing protein [Williamsia sp. SKLECPSW1]
MAIVIGRIRLGTIWWSDRPSAKVVPIAFVVYADFGLASVLLAFVSPAAGLYGASLFAITGAYVAHFVGIRLRVAHIVFTSTVIVFLGVLSWAKGEGDVFGVSARVLVTLMVVNGTVTLQGVFAADMRGAIKRSVVDATHDPLTDVLNRRGFGSRVRSLIRRAPSDIALLHIDIDNFKQINDRLGHDAGDRILVEMAARIRREIGQGAVFARFGGDEFVVAAHLLDETLRQFAERVHAAASGADIVTASVGAATYVPFCERTRDMSLAASLAVADEALYAAKRAGSNRCFVATRDL